ncbi:hypothetical protein NL676_023474 [Syzygium grande]|nr:hypothetical protein NL676_023474 [Syzygium grande]
MELWLLILIALSVAALLGSIARLLSSDDAGRKSLPPGPLAFPVIGNFLWFRKSFSELEPILRSLHARHGPMVTLHIGPRPAVFVCSPALAHQALVHRGAVFADRPPPSPPTVSSPPTGTALTPPPTAPTGVSSAGTSRRRSSIPPASAPIPVPARGLEEKQIKQIEEAQRRLLLGLRRSRVLNFWPRLTKLVLRKRWKEFHELRENQNRVLVPLIKARSKAKREQLRKAEEDGNDGDWTVSYVDTLLDLELPEEKRKLEENEIVTLCSEFLNAGADTTSTALQWIMANLVKYPEIQERLYDEIKLAVGQGAEQVKEQDLQRMGYLKAVVLEGLRRHPPAHFVLPHSVTKDAELGGYAIPKGATINFTVAEMGWDPEVWEDPMAFKPERFLNSGGGGEAGGFDITGSREIKMMPFGVGRRICPGYGLAMLHLEYFVANLVWLFRWRTAAGEEVDLSETQEFSIVMKNPLTAQVRPRNLAT